MLFDYQSNFLSNKDADALLQWCVQADELKWHQEIFTLFGRQQLVPRLTSWCGDNQVSYRYTGVDHLATGWPDQLQDLKNQLSLSVDQEFNFLLCNHYLDGSHYMGWHQDNEAGTAEIIASISLGAKRRFRYRLEKNKPSSALELEHGSLLTFDGRWQHTLTKTKQPCKQRVNLTFRLVES